MKQYKLKDGKKVIIKSKKNVPTKKAIWNVYKNIPDNIKIPVVFQTKKQYLNEYIDNQEKKHNIDFPPYQEKQYINKELKNMAGICSRYTTKSNPYMKPKTVFFTDHKWPKNVFKNTAQHEVGHEIFERNKGIRKDWKSVNKNNSPTLYGRTDKEEDFAESYMLFKRKLLKDKKRKKIIKDNLSKNKQIKLFNIKFGLYGDPKFYKDSVYASDRIEAFKKVRKIYPKAQNMKVIK